MILSPVNLEAGLSGQNQLKTLKNGLFNVNKTLNCSRVDQEGIPGDFLEPWVGGGGPMF